jgi:hypothetical protein
MYPVALSIVSNILHTLLSFSSLFMTTLTIDLWGLYKTLIHSIE